MRSPFPYCHGQGHVPRGFSHIFALSFGKWTQNLGTHPPPAPRTRAGDDDVDLPDDFVEFHEPEPVHAGRGKNTGCEKQQK